MRRARWLGLVVLAVVVGGIAAAMVTSDDFSRAAAVARRRELYGQLPVFPGAVLLTDVERELIGPGDDGPTGTYTLERTYRLPAATRSADVVAFYTDRVPPGWTLLGDDYCSPEGLSRLLGQRSRINFFAAEWAYGDRPIPEGVGVGVSVRNGVRILTVEEPDLGCGSQADTTDVQAEDFDALALRDGPLALQLEALPFPNCALLAATFGEGSERTRVQLESGVDVPCALAAQAVRVEDLDGDGDEDVAMVDRVPLGADGMVLGRWLQSSDGSFTRDTSCEIRLAGGEPPHLAPC